MSPRDEWRIIGFGFGFGVVSLSALWAALGPYRFFTRVPLAILLAFWAIAAIAGFMLLINRGMRPEGALLAILAGSLQWLGLVILLIPVRLMFRSKVAIPGMRRPSGNQAAQFGIRQLLIWTTGVALTLGVLRMVAGLLGLNVVNWQFLAREGVAFGLLLAFNLILACSVSWAMLSAKNIGVRIVVATFVILVATFAEQPVFESVLGGGGEPAIFWWINAAGSICLVVNLLIVRLCGYRLVPDVK